MTKKEILNLLSSLDDNDEVLFRFDGVTLDFDEMKTSYGEGVICLSSENYFAEYDESSFYDDDFSDDDYMPYEDFEEYPS